jgi:hypothetical protein
MICPFKDVKVTNHNLFVKKRWKSHVLRGLISTRPSRLGVCYNSIASCPPGTPASTPSSGAQSFTVRSYDTLAKRWESGVGDESTAITCTGLQWKWEYVGW